MSHSDNYRVQVFTIEGEHIQTIRSDTKLRSPAGLCVDECYLYIVDDVNGYIVVYNRKGQYVSNFGVLTSDTYGIAMDRDGFLFVGCYGSNKIVVL